MVALVSSSIKVEVLLCWRMLQKLGVIPKEFPRARAAAVNASPVVVGTDTNRELVETEQGVKDAVAQMMEEFDSVFSEGGHLQPMKGESMTIHIQKDIYIKPLRICTPRKTPYAYQNAAKAKLDEDEANGIIEKVEGVSDWCSAMLFVPKPGGKVCSVLDLVHLNRYVQRPTHPFPAPKDIVARIPTDSVCYAVFDAKNGYWQVPLDDESKPYTTFITEWGRYRYKRAPMGLVSSGNEFCARTDRALLGVPGVHKLVDNILVFGQTYEELLGRIRQVFERCDKWGITLSKGKYQVGEEVIFAGFVVNKQDTRQDPKLVDAIAEFPSPKNVTDLQSLMGLANRFSDSAPDLKHAMKPLQGLLKKANAYVWGPKHEEALKAVKAIIINPEGPVLLHFTLKLPIQLRHTQDGRW